MTTRFIGLIQEPNNFRQFLMNLKSATALIR